MIHYSVLIIRFSQVHSLFSLLGLNRAYVTQQGSLVGVVALKEVRNLPEIKDQR